MKTEYEKRRGSDHTPFCLRFSNAQHPGDHGRQRLGHVMDTRSAGAHCPQHVSTIRRQRGGCVQCHRHGRGNGRQGYFTGAHYSRCGPWMRKRRSDVSRKSISDRSTRETAFMSESISAQLFSLYLTPLYRVIVRREADGLVEAAGDCVDCAQGDDPRARVEGVGDGPFAYRPSIAALRISGTVDTNSSDTFPPSFMVAATDAGAPSA